MKILRGGEGGTRRPGVGAHTHACMQSPALNLVCPGCCCCCCCLNPLAPPLKQSSAAGPPPPHTHHHAYLCEKPFRSMNEARSCGVRGVQENLCTVIHSR